MVQPTPPPTVFIVDDETSVSKSLARLMRSVRIEARTFESIQAFIDADCAAKGACVICDVHMPNMSGLQLPAELARVGKSMPVILITGFDTPEMREEAKRVGAVGYFRKPVDDVALLDAIKFALEP